AVISALEKAAEWEQALRLLRRLGGSRLLPDDVAYSSAISACANAGQWCQALALLAEMFEKKVAVSVITYNAVLSACEARLHFYLG
ncbi:PTAC2, partial [Symbiodinium microadriaticum]